MKTLIGALVKAKKAIRGLKKDGNNPFFKSKYVTLDEIHEAIETPLLDNGLFVHHTLSEDGTRIITTVYHEESEHTLKSECLITGNISDMQKMGSAISYARRYNLMQLLDLRVGQELDDDGNMNSQQQKQEPNRQTKQPKKANNNATDRLNSMAEWCNKNGVNFGELLAKYQIDPNGGFVEPTKVDALAKELANIRKEKKENAK
jgi:hypothetical protein